MLPLPKELITTRAVRVLRDGLINVWRNLPAGFFPQLRNEERITFEAADERSVLAQTEGSNDPSELRRMILVRINEKSFDPSRLDRSSLEKPSITADDHPSFLFGLLNELCIIDRIDK